jgi:hypothetical protein
MRVVVPVDVFPSNTVELLCCDDVDRQLRDGCVVANATAMARRTVDTAGQQASTTHRAKGTRIGIVKERTRRARRQVQPSR